LRQSRYFSNSETAVIDCVSPRGKTKSAQKKNEPDWLSPGFFNREKYTSFRGKVQAGPFVFLRFSFQIAKCVPVNGKK